MRKIFILPLALSCLSFGGLAPIALAQAPQGTLLHDAASVSWEHRGNDKVMKIVEADTPSGQAISARTKKRKSKPWDIALWADMDEGVQKGDEVQMQFWARTDKTPRGKDAAEFIVFVGRNEEPHDYIISEEFSPTSEWQLYTLTGTANADYNPGKLKAEYQLGKSIQTVEFGAMYVRKFSPAAN